MPRFSRPAKLGEVEFAGRYRPARDGERIGGDQRLLERTIAGSVLSRERLRGIGRAITMPLFFGSNALYRWTRCRRG
ncbi:hypothetical protein DV20_28060 [Amycolatopsis rifamycinica]|uniref:Uncharacterized protein n=1 Tax=Amycolatopsis rifamycinica TaxID=287986 RepID=A0A066TUP0_9PSEU|nr:hypothetical protein [Amycolatopsis rifamycinica]KDN18911.1 hypothetical protein DV20_28060 [Amycolatopsis rifamycinica]